MTYDNAHLSRLSTASPCEPAEIFLGGEEGLVFNSNIRGVSTVKRCGAEKFRSPRFANFTSIENYGAKTPKKRFMC